MHQYQCNGVLAGIAICRAGFPNKMLYPEFKARYNILGASLVAKAKNDKAAAGAVLDLIKLPAEKFRLGHTKVFFRAGILGEHFCSKHYQLYMSYLKVLWKKPERIRLDLFSPGFRLEPEEKLLE